MKKSRPLRKIVFLIALAAVVAGLWYGWQSLKPKEPVPFRTVKAVKRDVVRAIDATGTVEPEDLVDVGARVSGEIVSFGKDVNGKVVDYGSEVREGEMLALVDDQIPKSDLLEADAKLAQAKASQVVCEAKLKKAERDWQRAERLGVTEALSKSAYDSYLSAWESAKAELEVAKATVVQAEAAKSTAQRNLEYCVIKAPVNGVIIDRKVNIGQTVVSNMSASSLFLIAKDLKKMEVWASVNEADIGEIRPGMDVSFTVDAFPNDVFHGKVGKIRLNATMTQNVVTYIVEVITDNEDGKLLPYLTANLKFELESAKHVLAVPSAALRYAPEADMIDPAADPEALKADSKVWVAASPYTVKPLPVKTGLTDGEFTAVKGDLKPGDTLIVGVQLKASASQTTSNPFTPTPPRRAKKSNAPGP